MITIDQTALKALKEKLDIRQTPHAHIRLGIKGGSCNGYSYVIEFCDEPPSKYDEYWEESDVNFVVDKKSFSILDGSTLFWKDTLIKKGFEFNNPKEVSRCGCGSSFSI